MEFFVSARKIVRREEGGYRVQFLCQLCDAGYTSGLIAAASEPEATSLAAKEARPFFNCCFKCGSWVCDYHYNEDQLMCVRCAPRDEPIV